MHSFLQKLFFTKKSHYHHLKDKWSTRHSDTQKRLWDKHKEALSWLAENPKKLALGSLSGLIMLAAPGTATLPAPHTLLAQESVVQTADTKSSFIAELGKVLPQEVQPLTIEEEQEVSAILSKHFNLGVIPEIGDKRLERSYGYIGQEQHLMRFPGDTVETHFDGQPDTENYGKHGLAPGRGAWGYFANSQQEMTKVDIEREKYYIAVPTFMAPDFNQRVGEYRDFFKYRKMLVVNPENGKAMVTVIGDAGPATWTGKHLGGSPEVMRYLERVDGRQKGPVLYFFIDDPNDTIPLGPIQYN